MILIDYIAAKDRIEDGGKILRESRGSLCVYLLILTNLLPNVVKPVRT